MAMNEKVAAVFIQGSHGSLRLDVHDLWPLELFLMLTL